MDLTELSLYFSWGTISHLSQLMLCCISDTDVRKCHTASLLLQQNKEYVNVMYVFQITLQNSQIETGQFDLS